MQEYCEDTVYCRRKMFREKFTESRLVHTNMRCNLMCDNCKTHAGQPRRSFLPPQPNQALLLDGDAGLYHPRYGNPLPLNTKTNSANNNGNDNSNNASKPKSGFQKASSMLSNASTMEADMLDYDDEDGWIQTHFPTTLKSSTSTTAYASSSSNTKLGLGSIRSFEDDEQKVTIARQNSRPTFVTAKVLHTTNHNNNSSTKKSMETIIDQDSDLEILPVDTLPNKTALSLISKPSLSSSSSSSYATAIASSSTFQKSSAFLPSSSTDGSSFLTARKRVNPVNTTAKLSQQIQQSKSSASSDIIDLLEDDWDTTPFTHHPPAKHPRYG